MSHKDACILRSSYDDIKRPSITLHQSCGSLISVQVTHRHNNNLFNKPNWSIYNTNYFLIINQLDAQILVL